MSALAIDLAERRRFELAREWAPGQRLGWFEKLLADLSAAFINVPCNQVDAGIRHAQQRIVEPLDLDRCTLSVVEGRDLVHSDDWTSPEFLSRAWFPPGTRISARELFPWTLAKIQAGELVQFSSADEMPDVRDRESYSRFGTKSTVIVPHLRPWTSSTSTPRHWNVHKNDQVLGRHKDGSVSKNTRSGGRTHEHS